MTRLRRILLHCDTEPVSIGAGLYTLLYGLWFLGPASFAGSATYAIVAQGLNETQFGLLAATIGLAQLVGVLGNRPKLRRWGAAAAAFWWAFLVILNGISSHWTAGGLPHFALAALSNAWLYLRRSIH